MELQLQEIQKLFQLPLNDKDLKWETRILELIPQLSFEIINPDLITESDGWPYLKVALSGSEEDEASTDVLSWLNEMGAGLWIGAKDKDLPDYHIRYGMIWNYFARGRFISETLEDGIERGEKILIDESKVYKVDIPETYLPLAVRDQLKFFFKSMGLTQVKCLLLTQDAYEFSLHFSEESLGTLEKDQQGLFLESISWFFPLHYQLGVSSEKFFDFDLL